MHVDLIPMQDIWPIDIFGRLGRTGRFSSSLTPDPFDKALCGGSTLEAQTIGLTMDPLFPSLSLSKILLELRVGFKEYLV